MTAPGPCRGFDAALAGLPGVAVLSDADAMAPHLTDWRRRHTGSARAVAFPRTTEAVSEVVKLCAAHDVPIFPQGGNTSVCGGSVPDATGRGIVLNLARMNRIRSLDPDDDSLIVDAGCVLGTIQEAASRVDRLFPMSLGAEGSCQIGGNIATNAGGTSVLRYGNMRDLVLGVEVVLADGSVWDGLRTLRKNNSGYDLKDLMIGSEGTLGIVTGAALRLFPKPAGFVTAMFALPSIEAVLEVGRIVRAAFPGEVCALEVISRTQMANVLRHVEGARLALPDAAAWYLLTELAGPGAPAALEERLTESLSPAMESGLVEDAVLATSERQRAELWALRHNVTEANVREGMGLTHDIAVPIARIGEFVRRAEAVLADRFPEVRPVVVGHIGDGNLHYIAMLSHKRWQATRDRAGMTGTIGHAIYDIAVGLGGTFSAEHGIGSIHTQDMARYKNGVELALMHGIKSQFDPKGLLNPGRVLPG